MGSTLTIIVFATQVNKLRKGADNGSSSKGDGKSVDDIGLEQYEVKEI